VRQVVDARPPWGQCRFQKWRAENGNYLSPWLMPRRASVFRYCSYQTVCDYISRVYSYRLYCMTSESDWYTMHSVPWITLSYWADQEIRKFRVSMERKCVFTNTCHGTQFSASLMYSIVLHLKIVFSHIFPSTTVFSRVGCFLTKTSASHFLVGFLV
jgi:hypothetical protein